MLLPSAIQRSADLVGIAIPTNPLSPLPPLLSDPFPQAANIPPTTKVDATNAHLRIIPFI